MAVHANRMPYILAAIGAMLLIGTLLHQSNNLPDSLKVPFKQGLKRRLAHSEAMYDRLVEERHEMLKQYPDPTNKDMYRLFSPSLL